VEHHPVTTLLLCPLCHHTAPLPLPPSATTPLLCHRVASAVASAAFVAAAASAAASVTAVAAAASVAASVSASSSVLCRHPLPLCRRPLPLLPPRRHFCRRLPPLSPLPPLSLIDCCIAASASRHLSASPSSTPEEDGKRGQLGSGLHGHK
jgi:hypothetical protein